MGERPSRLIGSLALSFPGPLIFLEALFSSSHA
jgi:hypothetical protein